MKLHNNSRVICAEIPEILKDKFRQKRSQMLRRHFHLVVETSARKDGTVAKSNRSFQPIRVFALLSYHSDLAPADGVVNFFLNTVYWDG